MRTLERGLSLVDWRNSFAIEDPEEGRLFAEYCNNLAGDSRFQRLLNFMEATASVQAIQGSDAEEREHARLMTEAIAKLRQAIRSNIAVLVVEEQKLAAEMQAD